MRQKAVLKPPMARLVLKAAMIGNLLALLLFATPGTSRAQGSPPVALCTLGERGEFVIGANFWQATISKFKDVPGTNATAVTWLGCADTDIRMNHMDSAKVRLDQILA